jgi:hypothetical protein
MAVLESVFYVCRGVEFSLAGTAAATKSVTSMVHPLPHLIADIKN